MPARTSPSGFAAPYNFSISPTCGFIFGDSAGTCFHIEYTPHPALKRLRSSNNDLYCLQSVTLSYGN